MLDISTILAPIVSQLITFWYCIPILLIILFFKSAFGKGLLGEFLVNFTINIRLDKEKYHLIKNITLPTENGTTQIDHILVSEFGIFIIETKNMKGFIYGSEKQKDWIQKNYNTTNKFQNPLHQNYKHIKTIESLGIDSNKIFSLVVFVGDSSLKTTMPENVTLLGDFIKYIKSKTQKLISPYEMKKIISLIESKRVSQTLKTHHQHIKHVQEVVKEKNDKKLCPKCGNNLVIRIAKQGENKDNKFYGCTNYPKCRYTTSIIQ